MSAARGAFRLTWLDVFTDTPLAGNGLAVVHDADALSDETMHAFARETKLSETSFVLASGVPGADYRHRIWMPSGEIPFAGHPSLGAAVAVAHARGERETTLVQETLPGIQPIDVRLDGLGGTASMLQEPAVMGPELDPAEHLVAVGLAPGDADHLLPPQVVSTGAHQLIVPIRDPSALARIHPDYDLIDPLLEAHDAVVLYVAACDTSTGRVRARSFASGEVGEDPATGAAAGPLCAYIAERAGCPAITIEQGEHMGRPSRLRAEMEGSRPRVSGDVVILAEGTVHLGG